MSNDKPHTRPTGDASGDVSGDSLEFVILPELECLRRPNGLYDSMVLTRDK